jgi:class 3 adenylate cyclase
VRQERKVVTVLFCDLVGFTAQAEEMDPEDVAAMLGPYHARLKEELERYGGTVEKFIGDAVMALFGAPVAHEDDPERAVRAALAIREYAAAVRSLHQAQGGRAARRLWQAGRSGRAAREGARLLALGRRHPLYPPVRGAAGGVSVSRSA